MSKRHRTVPCPHNNLNQLVAVKTNGVVTDEFTYNEKGAVVSHNGKTYAYDEWNRLSSVTEGEETHTYTYDANGIRTSKDGKKYIVDVNNNVVAETDAEGTIISETLWGHKPLARKTGGNWYYYIYNAHDDVIGMVDDEGNLVNNYTYDAWGNVLSETETVENPIKYAGEYYDAELDMYYLRARYYQPQTGRFTSLDILEGDVTSPLDLNRYVYCRNNPVKYTDPSGENAAATWAGSMWWLIGVDGLFPIGEVIYVGGIVVLGVGTAIIASRNNQKPLEKGMSANQKAMFQREIEDYKREMGKGPGDHLPWEVLVEIAREVKDYYK